MAIVCAPGALGIRLFPDWACVHGLLHTRSVSRRTLAYGMGHGDDAIHPCALRLGAAGFTPCAPLLDVPGEHMGTLARVHSANSKAEKKLARSIPVLHLPARRTVPADRPQHTCRSHLPCGFHDHCLGVPDG